jgi:DNA-binding CsgD family transcriptional regulator
MATVVGRDRELEAIGLFLGGRGGPRVLLLDGAAGIGKTTVWEAACRTASSAGYRVLTARPLEVETRISFSAIADLLRGVLDEVAAALPAPQRRALEVALLLRDSDGPPPESQAIAFAILSALRALARSQSTIVAVDDVQWLDQPSAAILAYAARRLGDEPIRLLLARRADGAAAVASSDLGRAIDGTPVETIALGPLSAGALQRMFHEELGDGLPRRLLHRIHAASGGNPFHALELGRALVRHGTAIDAGDPLPVPETLVDLVEERLESLPRTTAAALQVAALTPEATSRLIGAAMDDRFDLSPAVAAGIVKVQHDRVIFSHPLFASGIAARMSGPTRRDVHRRLAHLAADPEERARHLALSVSVADPGIAAELESAAAEARARGSPTASAELLEHAVRLSSPGEPAAIRRTVDAADAHFEAGDTDRALALLEAMSGALPPGAERADVLYRLAIVHGELDADLGPTIELYERALAEPRLDPLLAARIHGDLAWLAIFTSTVADGLREAELAVALSENLESPGSRAEARTALAFVTGLAGGDLPEGWLDSALEREASGERFRIDRCPSLVLGVRLSWRGDLEAARLRFESVRRLALERGDETNTSIAHYHLANLALQRGQIERAAEHVQEAGQLADRTGVNVFESGLARASLAAHLGRTEAAMSTATETLSVATRSGDRMNALRALAVLGFLELSRDKADEANRHLTRAVELSGEIGLGDPGLLRFIPDAVEALVRLGRTMEAEVTLARFEQPARRAGYPWALAAVDRCRGLLRAATNDLSGGLSDLERARDVFDGLPLPFEFARTLLALGGVERRLQRRRQARATLERALQLFHQLAAPLWAERARAELARIGGRTPAGDDLTPYERRIAELVAAGGTNKEVAASLFVTVHTVEAALTRIYSKVGVRSRTELANRLAPPLAKM